MIFEELNQYRLIELNIKSDIRFNCWDLFKDKRFYLIEYDSIDKQAYEIRGLSYFYNLIKSVKDKIIVFDYPLSKKDKMLLCRYSRDYINSNIIFINDIYEKVTSNRFSNPYTSPLLYLCDLSLSITINQDIIKIIKNKDRLDIYLSSSIQKDEKYIESIYLKTKRARKLYQILDT